MDKYYKTDISPEQFELIREDLEAAKKLQGQENIFFMIFFVLCYIFLGAR